MWVEQRTLIASGRAEANVGFASVDGIEEAGREDSARMKSTVRWVGRAVSAVCL